MIVDAEFVTVTVALHGERAQGERNQPGPLPRQQLGGHAKVCRGFGKALPGGRRQLLVERGAVLINGLRGHPLPGLAGVGSGNVRFHHQGVSCAEGPLYRPGKRIHIGPAEMNGTEEIERGAGRTYLPEQVTRRVRIPCVDRGGMNGLPAFCASAAADVPTRRLRGRRSLIDRVRRHPGGCRSPALHFGTSPLATPSSAAGCRFDTNPGLSSETAGARRPCRTAARPLALATLARPRPGPLIRHETLSST